MFNGSLKLMLYTLLRCFLLAVHWEIALDANGSMPSALLFLRWLPPGAGFRKTFNSSLQRARLRELEQRCLCREVLPSSAHRSAKTGEGKRSEPGQDLLRSLLL